jgi:hypothetical protein
MQTYQLSLQNWSQESYIKAYRFAAHAQIEDIRRSSSKYLSLEEAIAVCWAVLPCNLLHFQLS